METPTLADRDIDVLVVGGALADIVAQGDRLPEPGEAVQAKKGLELNGGKGVNQAVAAARLGGRAALITQLSTDARGDRLLLGLAAEGVDVEGVGRSSLLETGVSLIFVDADGTKQVMTVPGLNAHVPRDVVEDARGLFPRARVVLVNLELPDEAVGAAIALGRRAGATIVLDPAPVRELPAEALRFVDVIRPNAREAVALTGVEVKDVRSAREAARRMMDKGVGAAVVAAGEIGNLAVWDGGEQLFPKIPLRAIDVTGAGDAFCAGLSVALAEEASLEEACRLATAAAALATTKLGAQHGLPRREDVVALLESWAPNGGASASASP